MKTSESSSNMDTISQQFDTEFSKFPLKKRRFLERFAETGSISTASSHAGVSRRMHLKWKAKDKSFSVAWEEALGIAIDSVEGEARRRAVDGILEPVYHGGRPVGAIRKYSDVLLIFLLKAMKPEKYRDTYPGYRQEPPRDREAVLKEIHGKLARLAAQGPTAAQTSAPTNRSLPHNLRNDARDPSVHFHDAARSGRSVSHQPGHDVQLD